MSEALKTACDEQRDSTGEHPDDHTRIQPVEPLSLFERAVNQSERTTEVREAAPSRGWAGKSSPRNSKINEENHQRRDNRGGPEDPTPGEMFHVPAFQQSCGIAHEHNLTGICRESENN